MICSGGTCIYQPDSSCEDEEENSEEKKTEGKLSGGAIAGIAVGGAAGVAIIGAVAYYFCIRKPDV